MSVLEKIEEILHCQVKFETSDGIYEGFVNFICPKSKRLVIEKVILLPNKVRIGTLHLFFHEIISYSIIKRLDATDLNGIGVFVPASDENHAADDDDFFDDDTESVNEIYVDDLYAEQEYKSLLAPHLVNFIPKESKVIDDLNNDFFEAIENILLQEKIGVSFEGAKVERHGLVSWINISSLDNVYLFDIEALQTSAFDNGLRSVFENAKIEKIIHDCRHVSDCSLHLFQSKLINVFDTQVADLFVIMQNNRDSGSITYVNNLDSCLRTYLEVEEIYICKRKRFPTFEDNLLYWKKRPLSSKQHSYMLKNVVYLHLLRRELQVALMTPYNRAVQVYLQCLRVSSDQELKLELSKPNEVPKQLLMEDIRVVQFKDYIAMPRIISSGPPYRKMKNPLRDFISHDSFPRPSSRSYSIFNNESSSTTSDTERLPTEGFPVCPSNIPNDNHVDLISAAADTKLLNDKLFKMIIENKEPKDTKPDSSTSVTSSVEAVENSVGSDDSSLLYDSLSDSNYDFWTPLREQFLGRSPRDNLIRKKAKYLPAGMHL